MKGSFDHISLRVEGHDQKGEVQFSRDIWTFLRYLKVRSWWFIQGDPGKPTVVSSGRNADMSYGGKEYIMWLLTWGFP